jgi:hypothetical protein
MWSVVMDKAWGRSSRTLETKLQDRFEYLCRMSITSAGHLLVLHS